MDTPSPKPGLGFSFDTRPSHFRLHLEYPERSPFGICYIDSYALSLHRVHHFFHASSRFLRRRSSLVVDTPVSNDQKLSRRISSFGDAVRSLTAEVALAMLAVVLAIIRSSTGKFVIDVLALIGL